MLDQQEYATFCGPAALSSVYSITRQEAAEFLTYLGGNLGGGWTSDEAMTSALGVKPLWLFPWYPEKQKWVYPRWGRPRFLEAIGYPTITQFLREHPEGEYVLSSSYHYIHVKDGVVVKDNGTGGSRMRIRRAWPLDGAHVHRSKPNV